MFVCNHLALLGCFVAVDFFQVLKSELVDGSRVKKELVNPAETFAGFSNVPYYLLPGHTWEFLLANLQEPRHWMSLVLFFVSKIFLQVSGLWNYKFLIRYMWEKQKG